MPKCAPPPTRTPGDAFICAECGADAKQFIEIQDNIWVEAGEASESTDETDKPAHP